MRAAGKQRVPNHVIALIFIAALAVASYWAFTKQVPWGGGTQFNVVFESAQNLRTGSPVRIAGIEVGEVRSVEVLPTGDGRAEADGEGSVDGGEGSPAVAVATLELDDEALPLKEDATFKLRPRLFLEGNLFVEVRPGSPAAAAVPPDHTFPLTQSSNSVQLDRIFTGALQSDVRSDLRVLLRELGTALIEGGGAESLRTLFRTSPGAFRDTARVNEALLGQRPRDLSGLVRNLGDIAGELTRNEVALQDTVTNLRIVTGSLAAEDAALERAIAELPATLRASGPAFASLNAAFPPLRAFAREALPGVETAPETFEVSTPLVRQLRLLARPQELRGLVSDLRPAVPNLARLARRTVPFLEEARALSSCFSEVIIPWSADEVDGGPGYPHPPVGPVYKETGYGLVGIAGEARSQDANGQYFRVLGGGGLNTVSVRSPTGEPVGAGLTPFPIEGAMPAIEASAKTPFRPEEPCENQDPPDLRATMGPPPEQSTARADAVPSSGTAAQIMRSANELLDTLGTAAELRADGERAEARELQQEGLRQSRRFERGRYGD